MRRSRLQSKRTKIVCTLGPATSSTAMIEKLIMAGMNVARLNLSHGTLDEHAHFVKTIRNLSRRLGIEIAVLIDLPGPKYRTGKLKGDQAILKKGAQIVFTTEQIEGDATMVSVNLPDLAKGAKVGNTVLLADGEMQAKVIQINGSDVKCRITVGGILTEGRGLVIPGMPTYGPFVTDDLREKILFAIAQSPDYLALSFVTTSQDIADVRSILQENSADIPIISKIERGEAVKNFDRILAISDGAMVARGDLGVEIPLEKVPLVQKEIIRKCNHAGKPVITATEMLESMVKSARPTRAETTDVANAIFDGTDATMLSEETSVGEYPLEAVKMMDRIARQTEKKLPYELALSEKRTWFQQRTEELISYAACVTAHSLDARAIILITESGSTAVRVSKYRPRMNILAMTTNEVVCRRLILYWGVQPILVNVSDDYAKTLTKQYFGEVIGDEVVSHMVHRVPIPTTYQNTGITATVISHTSINWAGYEALRSANDIKGAAGQFVAEHSTNGVDLAWVGVGGEPSTANLAQIGLDMNYNNGEIVPFYEMYPQQSSIQPIYNLTAYTGDTLLCMVCKDPNNSAETEFEIVDWTNYNWIFFEYLFVPTPYSAEWIIETPNNPQEYEGTYPIVNFSDCTWTDGNGNPQNINSSEDTTLWEDNLKIYKPYITYQPIISNIGADGQSFSITGK